MISDSYTKFHGQIYTEVMKKTLVQWLANQVEPLETHAGNAVRVSVKRVACHATSGLHHQQHSAIHTALIPSYFCFLGQFSMPQDNQLCFSAQIGAHHYFREWLL